ncbi:MAG: hypothetical protein RBU36_12635, partial [Thermoanaerobaculia bacterium]|nr:hypothetical protein [Thermoanaerobaculia bacterium]
MSRVFFDSQKHALEKFAFTFSTDSAAIRLEADKPRQCRMRYAIGGEPEMGDPRRFRMYPEDAALCVGNAKKRLTAQPKGGIPQLFEHGWGMYGGKAGGYWLDLSEEGGDLWALVVLDEQTWEEAVEPGMNWFGRSMGFSGWVDPDGFIRPADIFEGSFTNFPAMKGLGTVEPMAQLEARLSSRSFVAFNGLLVPQHLATAPTGAPEGPCTPEAGGEDVTRNTSPAEARPRKEQEMNLSAATLKLLGFAEGEKPTQEQIDTAFAKTLESAGKNRASSGSGAEGDEKPLSKGDVLDLLGQFREEDRTKLRDDLEAELAKRERARSIEAVILEAENAGFATAAEREDLRKDGELLGPERLKAQLSKRAPSAPTRRVFVPGDEATTFSTGTPG